MHELIYVIVGKPSVASLVSARCKELLDTLLQPNQRVTGLFNADPAQVTATDVLDELRTLPFLTERRVVLIKGADDFVSKNRPLLENYFDKPCPTGTLILTVTSWNANTKLAKKLGKVGKLISVTGPKPWQLPVRLTKYAGDAHGKKLTREAGMLLIELAGDDLSRLYSEIDKLALFAGTEKAITARHVESLIGHNRLFNAFAVIDAITAGAVAQAIERLRKMFAADKSAEFSVVGAFAFHLRRMFNAKTMLEKGLGKNEIAKKLQIWSNTERFFSQLRKMTLRQIGANLQNLAQIDYELKTGRTKAHTAMEQFILKLVDR